MKSVITSTSGILEITWQSYDPLDNTLRKSYARKKYYHSTFHKSGTREGAIFLHLGIFYLYQNKWMCRWCNSDSE